MRLVLLISQHFLVGDRVPASFVNLFLDAVILADRAALGEKHAPLGAAVGVGVTAELEVCGGAAVLGRDQVPASVSVRSLESAVVGESGVAQGGLVVLELVMGLGPGEEPCGRVGALVDGLVEESKGTGPVPFVERFDALLGKRYCRHCDRELVRGVIWAPGRCIGQA